MKEGWLVGLVFGGGVMVGNERDYFEHLTKEPELDDDVWWFPGVGRKTYRLLLDRGVKTIRDLMRETKESLIEKGVKPATASLIMKAMQQWKRRHGYE